MAKEFQDFNRRYAKLAGTALKTIKRIGGQIPQEDIDNITEWGYREHFTEAYSAADIRYAVYESTYHDTWQQFRVSLKGLNTKEKLYALSWYWDRNIAPGTGIFQSREQWQYEIIRVNNYLGALKRSGHLDADLKVSKL